jgi:hypothetical protein
MRGTPTTQLESRRSGARARLLRNDRLPVARGVQGHDRDDETLPGILQVVLVSTIPVGAACPGATTAVLRPPGHVVRGRLEARGRRRAHARHRRAGQPIQ